MAPGLLGNTGQGHRIGASLLDFRVIAEYFVERLLYELSDAADGDDVEPGSWFHVSKGIMEIEIVELLSHLCRKIGYDQIESAPANLIETVAE